MESINNNTYKSIGKIGKTHSAFQCRTNIPPLPTIVEDWKGKVLDGSFYNSLNSTRHRP